MLGHMAKRMLHLGSHVATAGEVVAGLGIGRGGNVLDDALDKGLHHALFAREVRIEGGAAHVGGIEYLLNSHARIAPLVEEPLKRMYDRRLGAGHSSVCHGNLPNDTAHPFGSERMGALVCCLGAMLIQL